jgi:hypothetical protein
MSHRQSILLVLGILLSITICAQDSYSAADGKRRRFDYGDQVFKNKWHFVGSDSLNINGEKYHISKLTSDSLIVIGGLTKTDSFYCVKSNDQNLKDQ